MWSAGVGREHHSPYAPIPCAYKSEFALQERHRDRTHKPGQDVQAAHPGNERVRIGYRFEVADHDAVKAEDSEVEA